MPRLPCWIAAMILVAAMSVQVSAQFPRQGDLKVGDAAPDFTVKGVQGKKAVTLSELRGKPVVLLFGSCT